MEPWLIRIADYLLAQSWQIAVLTIAVALATFGLRNRSAHVRYLLWLIVLAKALVPPLYSIPVAVLPQQERAASVPAPPTAERIVAEHRAPEAAGTQAPRPAAGQSQAASSPQVTKEPARYDTRAWLAVVWLAGVIALSFYYLANALRTQIWLQRRRKTLPGESARAVESFFAAHGLKRMPRVWLLERINQPFVWGLMRGSIYLPARLLDNRHAKFQASLLGHELCHVIRLDATINLLQVIAQTVFWFHPCLWWANAKIRAEREKCCDEMTIARLNARPEEYSEAIIETLGAKYEQARPVPSLAVAGQVKNIEERINTMLRPGKKFHKHPTLTAATVALLLAVCAVPTTLVLTARAVDRPTTEAEDVPHIFGNPTNLGPSVNSFAAEYDPSISADELELYFNSYRPGGLGQADLWVTTRRTKADPWGDAVNLGLTVNSPANDGAPSISADGLSLYFSSDRPGGHGGRDLWMTTRKTKSAPWSEPVNLGPTVNSASDEHAPSISSDGLELYFSGHSLRPESARPGGSGGADLWVTTKKTTSDPWGAPVNLGPTVNSPLAEAGPSISGDGLSLYFVSDRPGGSGVGDLWVTMRKSKSDPWGIPVNLGPAINTAGWDLDPDISRDGSTLYFVSPKPGGVGGSDIWQATVGHRAEDTPESRAQSKLVASLDEAVKEGDIEQVRSLLSQGAGVNAKDKEGRTPLHWAAWHGRREVAQVLIAKGASVNEIDAARQTPLHLAASFATKFVPELLLAKGARVDARDIAGNTPLHLAADCGARRDFLEFLIAKGADVKARNEAGQTPLHLVARRRGQDQRPELVAPALLDRGAEVDAKDKGGNTPLHFAVENGHRKLVELLLAKGADIEAKATDGTTPLHRAVNRSDVVELLLDRGADVNVKTVRGETPAQRAALWNRKDTVKLLLSKGAEVSTIQLAAYVGDLAKVKSFVEKGVSVSTQDEFWPTALHAAAASGQREVAEFLISNGASVNAQAVAQDKETPLYWAAYRGSTEVAELLLSKGAEIDARDTLGFTALHGAAMVGDAEMVRLLIAHGADLNAKTLYGKTSLYYAAWSDSDEVVKLLIDKGAIISKDDNLLTYACVHGHKDLAELLIKQGANVNSKVWGDALTLETIWSGYANPTKEADRPRFLAILTLLLDNGADPNAKDRCDWSLLHYACCYKGAVTDLTRLLLDKGANPNAVENECGLTPLHLAADKGDKAVVRLLLSRGADVNAKDYYGRIPLSYAEDLGDNDPWGNPRSTPLTAEAKSAKKEVAELLRKHGATQ